MARFRERTWGELQILPLLRWLFLVSGGTVAGQLSQFDPDLTDLTALDNLNLYGLAFGVHTPAAQPSATGDLARLHKALSRSPVFVKCNRSATVRELQVWRSHLTRSLPITFPS